MEPRYQAAPQVLAQEMGEELLLLHLTNDRHYALNATAAELWLLFEEGPASRGSLVDALQARFAVPRTRLLADVEGVLSEWLEAGLVLPLAAGPVLAEPVLAEQPPG